MKISAWSSAIKHSADPQRARHHLDLLAATNASAFLESASSEQARILCALFAGSQALSDWLTTQPDEITALTPEQLARPRLKQGLDREAADWLTPLLDGADYPAASSRLHLFKQREMLRIAARDLARLAKLPEIVQELSDVADVCLDVVWRLCWSQLSERLGQPYHKNEQGKWQKTAGCVFGMGKLGGQELNYSSDVDVIFVYGEEGFAFKTRPVKQNAASGITNHQYFNRLAEMFIAEVSRMTSEGTLYRIDLRLRPEGDAGPLSRSQSGYENYYAQWGQTWERMMLIKARRVAGDETLAAEFLEMIHPFRYPRLLSEGVAREVAAMKDRIENEVVKAGELDRNVKLGRGGIREIEFVAQTLQLINAGRMPFLQCAQTLPALEKLLEYGLLAREEVVALSEAYCFLRDVEHRLQMETNLQTHSIPVSPQARDRLAKLMGFKNAPSFEVACKKHTDSVRRVYDRLLKPETPQKTAEDFPREFTGAEVQWTKILSAHGFKDTGKSMRLLNEFVNGPGYVHVSARTVEVAWRLVPKFLALCPNEDKPPATGKETTAILSDPDRVLTRLDSFVTAYGARAFLLEAWNSKPPLFELLLLLFDRSEFLAELAIHSPDLVDELVTSGRLRQRKTAAEILKDLRHGASDADQHFWLRRYHQAELMRIALRDILGLADFEHNLAELSALADACLQYALEVVLRQNKIKSSPLAVIGLGKLGGAEINYGSDLDIVFVTDAKAKELSKLQRVAIGVMDLLSKRTELGTTFLTDARLRPDGEKGLLVNTVDTCESYYRKRAQLWEIQSLARVRPVAGNMEMGRQFQNLAAALANFSPVNIAQNFSVGGTTSKHKSGLAAYSADWKSQIRQMRERIEKERTPPGKNDLAIKTGTGGLMDAEFLAQFFCLANGWQEANTLRALIRARDGGVLEKTAADKLIENYRQLRRVEGILRRWSFEGETVLPDDPASFYRVTVRCGFRSADAFREALAQYRAAIRAVYKKVLCE